MVLPGILGTLTEWWKRIIKAVREMAARGRPFRDQNKLPMQIPPIAPADMHTTAVQTFWNTEILNWVMNLWGPIPD
jgi:hypothetical protein